MIRHNIYTECLLVGQIYANYPALCEKLYEPVLHGGSKEAQLRNWQRFFKWKRYGQVYVITHIYTDPLPAPKFKGLKNRQKKKK